MIWITNKKIWLNVLLILGFLSIPIFSSPDFSLDFSLFRIPPFQKSFAMYCLVILCFYLNTYLFLPKYYTKRKYVLLALCNIAMFLGITLFAKFVLDRFLFQPMNGTSPHHEMGFGPPEFRSRNFIDFSALPPFLVMILLSVVLYLNKRAQDIQMNMYQTELQNLKYQLQPHFLFNSLNNIYSLSIVEPEKASHYILKLSELLRHLLTHDQNQLIYLQEEISFCEQYIELQRLRFDTSENWEISIQHTSSNLKVSPFLLIPFVENVFKYGVHSAKPSSIKIIIATNNQKLQFYTFNQKMNSSNDSLLSQQKLGIAKTIERLNLIYQGNYQLDIVDTENSYEIKLSLELNDGK